MIEHQFNAIREARQNFENHAIRAVNKTHPLHHSIGWHRFDPDVQESINITNSTIDSLKLAIEAGEKLILELEKGRDLA